MSINLKYKAVLFDLDGTLLNTIDDIADSMNMALHRFGFPPHDVESYKLLVGDGVDYLVERSLPPDRRTPSFIDQCISAMREEYRKRWDNKTQPYDGIPELLDELENNGIKMAVLSNKPNDFTRLTVSKLLSRWKFDSVFGVRPDVPRKPDPAGALEIAQTLNLSPQDFLYIGDTGIDMKTANAAGMFAVGVLWGFRSADELLENGAKVLIEKPLDVLGLLTHNSQKYT